MYTLVLNRCKGQFLQATELRINSIHFRYVIRIKPGILYCITFFSWTQCNAHNFKIPQPWAMQFFPTQQNSRRFFAIFGRTVSSQKLCCFNDLSLLYYIFNSRYIHVVAHYGGVIWHYRSCFLHFWLQVRIWISMSNIRIIP